MKRSDIPAKHALPFALNGSRNAIPETGSAAGAASLTKGFPDETMTPIIAGGVPPDGKDMNGVLYELSAMGRWANAGAEYSYDAGFSASVGGYPHGARLLGSDGVTMFVSMLDDNSTDPEVISAAWEGYSPGRSDITLTAGIRTLTALEAASSVITLTGTLTGNVQLVFPVWVREWDVINLTTGAFTVTCRTGSGGVSVDQGFVTRLYGDGSILNDWAGKDVKGVVKTVNTHKPDANGNVKLGTAADADIVTSMTDTTAGRVPVMGWMGLGGYGTTILLTPENAKKPLPNGFYGVQADPAYGNAALISFGYDSGSQVHIIAKQGGQTPLIGLAGSTPQGDFGNWGKIYTEFQKPTAIEVGAVPYRGALGTVDLNTIRGTQYGRFNQSMTANATTARNYPIAEAGALDVHQTSANGPESCVQEYRSFSSRRIFLRSYNQSDNVWTDWCEYYTTAKKPTAADVGAIPLSGSTAVTGIVRNSAEFQSTSANNFRMVCGGYGTFWRQDGNNLYLMLTNSGDAHGSYNNLRPFAVNLASGYIMMGRLSLSDYTNFDARYNAKYPAQFRVGARVTYKGSDFFSHVPQGAVNINNMTDGDDRINGVQYAYLQYNLNGNWVNFA